MIIATAGHIDHGKTTLVRALTGIDTTHHPEERRRGMTIDLGFAWLDGPDGRRLAFVDVPGHQRFVRTMVGGVTGVDAALLVVAADDGPMPQTREHVRILELLGVHVCAVALTKVDRATPARVTQSEAAIAALFPEAGASLPEIIRVSAVTGEGVAALRARLEAHASTFETPATHREACFRMPVDRCFVVAGAGVVVTGTVLAGTIGPGATLRVLPGGLTARARGVQAHLREVERCGAGERCAINLAGAGVERTTVARGGWIVGPEIAVESAALDVAVRLLDDAPLRDGAEVLFCHGAGSTVARLRFVTTAAGAGPGYAHLALRTPTHALARDRFLLRDIGDTRSIGGGVIVDPRAPVRGYRTVERRSFIAACDTAEPDAAAAALLDLELAGVDTHRFRQAWNLRDSEAAAIWQRLGAVCADGRAYARGRWERERERLLAAVDCLAVEGGGVSEEDLAAGLPDPRLRDMSGTVLRTLVAGHVLVRTRGRYQRASQAAAFTPAEAALWAQVAPLLEHVRPMTVHSIGVDLQRRPDEIEALLRRAMKAGLVRRIESGRYFTRERFGTLARLAEELSRESPDGAFDVAAFRDRSGLGRTLSIELLEHFDGIRFTRRNGDRRSTLKAAHSIMA